MKVLVLLVALVGLAALVSCDRSLLVKSHSNSNVSPLWKQVGTPEANHLIEFRIWLKQRNLDVLEAKFWSVNDPQSDEYGLFLTKEEIREIVTPGSKVFEEVYRWLLKDFQPIVQQGDDYITVITTFQHASELFQTTFGLFAHSTDDEVAVGNMEGVTVPTDIAKHISFITGLEVKRSTRRTRRQPKINPLSAQIVEEAELGSDTNILVTPALIQQQYNVKPTTSSSDGNTQAIAAFNDYYSAGALVQFAEHFNLPLPAINATGKDCLKDQCDQFESDLDVQYITSLGAGVQTYFINTNKGWILEWASALNNQTAPAWLHSVSYGWTEPQQCLIDPKYCKDDELTNLEYINRTDIELQKLGTRGITVLIAAGDAGAPENGGAGGNCPMDPNVYCPVGGCNHTSTACPGVLFSSEGTTCYWPFGVGSSEGCETILGSPHIVKAFSEWAQANNQCAIAIDVDVMNNRQLYTNCSCSALQPFTFKNITVEQYTFSFENGAPFTPDYPASSPFIISVGATQFINSSQTVTSEIVSSIATGAIITGGGGFSFYELMPAYQQAAVSSWVSQYSNTIPAGYFNASNRAYPDITLVGHNFYVTFSTAKDQDQCPCKSTVVDGTSASTPSSAGLLSLINEALLENNHTTLGFINPTLYQLAGSGAFNDITSGNNNCNEGYCCEYGYAAAPGWDPASGLGSINWPVLLEHTLALKAAAKERRAMRN